MPKLDNQTLEHICLKGKSGQCPLLSKIVRTDHLICGRHTYIDMHILKPNCEK